MSTLYHVSPDGGEPTARPLSGAVARRSETLELQEDLRDEGFAASAPVIWLSPDPVSRAGRLFAVQVDRLDPDRLIPTFSAGGYCLYVGDLAAGSWTETNPTARRSLSGRRTGRWKK